MFRYPSCDILFLVVALEKFVAFGVEGLVVLSLAFEGGFALPFAGGAGEVGETAQVLGFDRGGGGEGQGGVFFGHGWIGL